MSEKHSRYLEAMKSFGKAVRFYRNKLGLSQEALADRAQLDRSYMSQIERGIKNATLNSIWRISKALEVKPSDLLYLTEELALAGEKTSNHKLASLKAPAAIDQGHKILVVDDDVDICATINTILQSAGFSTADANSGFDAFRMLSSEPIRAVVSDVRMANGNGLELLDAMRKHYPSIPVIFISGYDDLSQEDARRRGAYGFITKPFDTPALVSLVKSSIDESQTA